MRTRSSLTRRDLLVAGGALGAGLLLAGCGGGPAAQPVATAAATASPRSGGTFVYGQNTQPFSPLDMRTATTASGFGVGSQIYESLYRQRVEGGVDPGLAEKTEISSDGLTWTLTLRTAKFHDGTDFDAAAVKTNLDIRKSHPTFPFKAQLAPIKEVKVVSPRTVQLLLSQPSASLMVSLAVPSFGIQSPSAMAKYTDPAEYPKHAAGTGPFKLESATATEFRFERFAEYWGPKTYLDRLVIKVISDTGAQLAALEAGDINALDNVAGSERARLEQNPKLSVFPTPVAEQPWNLFFNMAKGSTVDKRVRQAIVYGLNRASYLDLTAGLGEPAYSIVPPNCVGYAKQTLYPYDPAKAKQMLTEAGVQPGSAIDIALTNSGYGGPLAQLVKQDLDRLGFQTTIRLMDTPGFTAVMSTTGADSKWQLAMQGSGTQYPDAESVLIRLLLGANDAPKGSNWVHYKNASFDVLVDQQSATTDPAARNKILAQAQQIVWDEAPIMPLMVTRRLIVTSKSVHNFESLASAIYRVSGTWLAP